MEWMEVFKNKMLGKYIDVEDIDASFDLKFSNIPGRLFKYREFDSAGYSLENLRDHTVWMNSPQSFNDPYDCAMMVNFYKLMPAPVEAMDDLLSQIGYNEVERERVIALFAGSPSPLEDLIKLLADEGHVDPAFYEAIISVLDERQDRLINDFSEKTKGLAKICSFCESEKSILMWAHYARDHTGFCIEYDFTSLGAHDLKTRFMYPVLYSEALHDHSDHMADLDRSKANPLSIVLPAITKNKEWSYEKEWRLVFSNNFLPSPISLPVPKPKRVYAGVRISVDNLVKLEQICNVQDIPLVTMRMSKTEFKIVPMGE
ncbi:DUF2971 domain-containing protein [Pseudomonas sp. S07E 245]|uniref:DUF2971 domain-containing protein n=1 Tax=Pseudomonas sp. S07E 245 TaxID=2866278 RepID=UPI001C72B2AA|nr:DUF2971 domain-containing protein [Pseudomonas sp. S07E 245]QYX54863.1 DUF2971 domain-containing protein [Pseudomonas sp. S07E 245]